MRNPFKLKNLIWFCAIGLAAFSGYYSVFGISKLFSGGSWTIVGMAAMLELSKLVVVTFLHDYFKTLKLAIKIYLSGAIIVLMSITSIGVYGYLTNSYQETAKVIYKTQNEVTLLESKKLLFSQQKEQIEKIIQEKNSRAKSLDQIRLSQQTAYTQQLNQKIGTGNLNRGIASIDKSSENLNGELNVLTQKSFALSDSISNIEQIKLTITNQSFSSELGPLLYLSRITGLPMDIVVNWFIIILVVVFDPLAISLVVAANHINSQQDKVSTSEFVTLEPQPEEPVVEESPTDETLVEETIEPQPENDEQFLENENKNLINTEEISILDESRNEFYGEVKDETLEQPVNNGVEDPWKRASPFVR